jgi:hypothetical protein
MIAGFAVWEEVTLFLQVGQDFPITDKHRLSFDRVHQLGFETSGKRKR